MSSLPEALRLSVGQRAKGRCEYCLVHEEEFLFPHEPDHIIATQHGGAAVLENLALACARCNRRKGPNLSSVDQQSGAVVPLFHPRRDSG
jgi:5-methylcytosine-specific restriction endonuclease McrA